MQELLSLFVLHKIVKVVIACKFNQMNFVGSFNLIFDNGTFVRPNPQQKPSIIFCDDGDGNVLKLLKDLFLSFFYVDKLCYEDHTYKFRFYYSNFALSWAKKNSSGSRRSKLSPMCCNIRRGWRAVGWPFLKTTID